MEILLFIVFIIISLSDGLLAVYSVLQRSQQDTKIIMVTQSKKEFSILSILTPDSVSMQGRTVYSFPKVVCDNGGRTGRGNPNLTRNRYTDIESIDISIERIID